MRSIWAKMEYFCMFKGATLGGSHIVLCNATCDTSESPPNFAVKRALTKDGGTFANSRLTKFPIVFVAFFTSFTTPQQTAVRLRGSEEYLEVIPLDPNNGMVTELPKGDVHKFRRLQFLCYILKIVTFATVSCDGLWWFMDTTFLSLLNSFGNYQTACSASSRLL